MIDIGLSGDLLMAFLNLLGGILILATNLLVCVARLGQLNLYISKGVLQLLVFDLSQAKHLSALFFGSLSSLNT
jgi:hypothetical protein